MFYIFAGIDEVSRGDAVLETAATVISSGQETQQTLKL